MIFAAILIAVKENIELDESSPYYVLGGCTFSVLFYVSSYTGLRGFEEG